MSREDSAQPVHSRSLIRIPPWAHFGKSRMQFLHVDYEASVQIAEAQADLNLRWAHTSEDVQFLLFVYKGYIIFDFLFAFLCILALLKKSLL